MLPYLNWKDGDHAVIPGGSVHIGKRVLLSGERYETLPSEFTVQRRFGLLLRQYREKRGLPITAQVGNPLPIRPVSEGEGEAGPLVLLTPGRRVKWRLFFEDGKGNSSGEIHISRLGTFRSLGLGASEGELVIDGDFTAAIDPHIELSVLTPWDTNGANLHPFLRELADDVCAPEESSAESIASLSEFLGEYLPGTPPPGWRFEVEPDTFDLEEGESVSFRIRVEAPSPGATAFALQMKAEISGEPTMVASDPLVVRTPEDGSHPVELLGDDNLSGGDSEEDELPQEKVREEVRGVAAN
jgi:hypothetical protein